MDWAVSRLVWSAWSGASSQPLGGRFRLCRSAFLIATHLRTSSLSVWFWQARRFNGVGLLRLVLFCWPSSISYLPCSGCLGWLGFRASMARGLDSSAVFPGGGRARRLRIFGAAQYVMDGQNGSDRPFLVWDLRNFIRLGALFFPFVHRQHGPEVDSAGTTVLGGGDRRL